MKLEGIETSPVHERSKLFDIEGEKLEWTLPTDITLVKYADEAMTKFLINKGCNPSEVSDFVENAFHEAMLNAMAHGNLGVVKTVEDEETIEELAKKAQKKNPTTKKVEVIAEVGQEDITVTIEDEGKGFKPEEIPDPRLPENLLKKMGRGLLYMKSYSSSVAHENEGRKVILRKKRKPYFL